MIEAAAFLGRRGSSLHPQGWPDRAAFGSSRMLVGGTELTGSGDDWLLLV